MLVVGAVLLIVLGVVASRCPANCAGTEEDGDSTCDRETWACLEGCKAGFYGAICSSVCDVNCLTKSCQQQEGTCTCRTGFSRIKRRCQSTEGTRCEVDNHHCEGNLCKSKGRGQCLHGCMAGWFGEYCDRKCTKSCICDQESGNCTGCVAGWFGAECESPCSTGCNDGSCHRKRVGIVQPVSSSAVMGVQG